MEDRINKIEAELANIKERNARVQADKAWETSWFRIISICVITYIVATLVLYFLGSDNYFLNALVPTAGYFLSVQSLPAIKKWWTAKNSNK